MRRDRQEDHTSSDYRVIDRLILMTGLFLLIILTVVNVQAVTTGDLKYFKLVQMPGLQDDQVLYIVIDREIFKYCEPDYSDIRLFDSEKSEIPLLIEKVDGDLVNYPVSEFNLKPGPDGKTITIDITMHREPVVQFVLNSDDSEFNASVTVTVQKGTGTETIGTGEIKSIRTPDGIDKSMIVSIPETRSDNYQLIIDGGHSEPPHIQGIECRGSQYRAVFKARQGVSYQLFWGSSTLGPPGYDLTELSAGTGTDKPMKRARVGRGFSNPEHADNKPAAKQTASGQSGLIIGIGLVLLAMIVIVFRRTGRGRDNPES
ncbi:hypothetical protein JW823_01605 [bacterium]|nr:hypothetical protein [candidate division CSSED10-310 bacterium]